MQVRNPVGRWNPLAAVVWRMLERFIKGAGSEAVGSSAGLPIDLPSPDDSDGYTIFEGNPFPFRRLSVERSLEPAEEAESLAGAFRIRLAQSRDSREQAGSLVKRRYASRGYQVQGIKTDARLFTFVAFDVGTLVGTVSLRLDSPQGLAADKLYKKEIDNLRRKRIQICEFTRLAVDPSVGSKRVLASLFHTAYLFAQRVRGREGAVIEVNPRHVVFYKRALGFECIGPERLSPRVRAPAVLLYVPFEIIAEGLATYAGKPELANSTHTLFPYGFSPKEEEGILGRLQALGPSASCGPLGDAKQNTTSCSAP